MAELGRFIKDRGGSAELSNMFFTLVDYYAKYQNSYVKHDDAVIEEEVEFVFEITSSFMKHAVRLNRRPPMWGEGPWRALLEEAQGDAGAMDAEAPARGVRMTDERLRFQWVLRASELTPRRYPERKIDGTPRQSAEFSFNEFNGRGDRI